MMMVILAFAGMFIMPVIPVMLSKSWSPTEQQTGAEKILRYLVYTAGSLFLMIVVLSVMSDDGTSFWVKVQMAPGYIVKVLALLVFSLCVIIAIEWICVKGFWKDNTGKTAFLQRKAAIAWNKYISPGLLCILALLVICLNFTMVNDRSVWGDEAFSTMTAQNDLKGIMQIMYFWDSHPPLYYIWLKVFGDIFGHSVTVYHAASLVPFTAGIILAVTGLRKAFGAVSAMFFVMVSGLGISCLHYNVEIRMYSLAFCCLAFAAYSAWKVISGDKWISWVGLVAWGLAAAYSHYYGLVAGGILVFSTGVAVWLKNRGKSWRKGLLAVLVFIILYLPWLLFIGESLSNMGNDDWWISQILGLDKSLEMVMGGAGMSVLLLPLLLLIVAALVLCESDVFYLKKAKNPGKPVCSVQRPSLQKWSDEIYFLIVGVAVVAGTLLFGYLFSVIVSPLLVERYLYPLCAIAVIALCAGIGKSLQWIRKLAEALRQSWIVCLAEGAAMGILILLLVTGMANYRDTYNLYYDQKVKTEQTLDTIGEIPEDVKIVTVGVKHLGWTVLQHYYPETEVINGNYTNAAECDKFWYMVLPAIDESGLADLEEQGYEVTYYGTMQLSQYPLELYYMERKNAR